MKYDLRIAVFAFPALLTGPMASAQDQSGAWEFTASVYLFAAETQSSSETSFGTVNTELSFADALKDLDFSFSGTVQATNGRWTLIGDYMRTDISFDDTTPGRMSDSSETDVKTQIFTGYAAYRVYEDQKTTLDLAGGLRWFSTDTEIDLIGGPADGTNTKTNTSWTNPLIGAVVGYQFSDRWSGQALVDYGGFDGDDSTWQILLSAGYKINDKWSLRLGYRHMEFESTDDGADYSYEQSGPVFGAAYRF